MLLHSLVYIILSSASILKRDFSILLSRVVLSNLLIIGYISYNSLYFDYLEKGVSLYNGLYQTNCNSQIFGLFIVILSYFILTITSYYPRKLYLPDYSNIETKSNFFAAINLSKDNTTDLEKSDEIEDKYSEHSYVLDKESNQFKILEYSLLILFVLCGAMFLMSINDIVSIFISIELQSYGLYLLSSVYRNSELSTKAGLTYFLLGGLSSCFILLSQALIYINSGNTNLENIYILCNINILSVDNTLNYVTNTDLLYNQFYMNMSLIILSIGFLFKISAAPFHFWSPDVYDGVPTVVTIFIAIIAKVSILVFLLQLVHFTNNTYIESLSYS